MVKPLEINGQLNTIKRDCPRVDRFLPFLLQFAVALLGCNVNGLEVLSLFSGCFIGRLAWSSLGSERMVVIYIYTSGIQL